MSYAFAKGDWPLSLIRIIGRVVERTFAWISRNRRLARNYKRLAQTPEAFIYLAMIRLGLHRRACPQTY